MSRCCSAISASASSHAAVVPASSEGRSPSWRSGSRHSSRRGSAPSSGGRLARSSAWLPKEILRLIQKFDFTKKNPKLIYINTGETMISLQDSILVTFLNLAGFDILFFVPTGYQSVENYFAEKLMEEHQIGEYKYDMQVPDLNNISTNSTRPSWRRKLFRRG